MPDNIEVTRRIDLRLSRSKGLDTWLRQEWLVTNGLGGYASGTIAGVVTWRYHGLLVAALPAPLGRMVVLNQLSEWLRLPNGRALNIGGEEGRTPQTPPGELHMTEFRLENQMPVWHWETDGIVLEKQLLLPYGQNTVHLHYRLLSSDSSVQLELHPLLHFRRHGRPVSDPIQHPYTLFVQDEQFEIGAGPGFPTLRLLLLGDEKRFLYEGGSQREVSYPREAERGHESLGVLWNPGLFSVRLRPQSGATLVASTESWHTVLALEPAEALQYYQQRRQRLICIAPAEVRDSPAADLVLAADQFITYPVGRIQDAARAHASGDELRTVIAGYHWFTDWGRDTMISLEGLALSTGRHGEAAWILRTFAHYVRHGLIPNLFPEGNNRGLYHTADASLWFFHALDRYIECTGDRNTLVQLLPVLIDIVQHHLRGTRFNIGMDPRDGLLNQGTEDHPLTWMDAKVGGWIVTPRRGKTVEINALWYNALRLLENWVRQESGEADAKSFAQHANRAQDSFNRRFWHAAGTCLYDIVDGEHGDDPACRPNQLIALSLKHPVLDPSRWQCVVDVAREKLLTPYGLRSLSPDHPDFKQRYSGDLRARDAAYHQGTVWAWLIGPFIDAWLRVHPNDRTGARSFLKGFESHLDEGCIGTINEIFDAQPPFTPRGCIAQAWSVAEVLRCWLKTAEKNPPRTSCERRRESGVKPPV